MEDNIRSRRDIGYAHTDINAGQCDTTADKSADSDVHLNIKQDQLAIIRDRPVITPVRPDIASDRAVLKADQPVISQGQLVNVSDRSAISPDRSDIALDRLVIGADRLDRTHDQPVNNRVRSDISDDQLAMHRILSAKQPLFSSRNRKSSNHTQIQRFMNVKNFKLF